MAIARHQFTMGHWLLGHRQFRCGLLARQLINCTIIHTGDFAVSGKPFCVYDRCGHVRSLVIDRTFVLCIVMSVRGFLRPAEGKVTVKQAVPPVPAASSFGL